MEIKFKATVRKAGNSHVITVPADFVTNGYLVNDKEYVFTVEQTGDANE